MNTLHKMKRIALCLAVTGAFAGFSINGLAVGSHSRSHSTSHGVGSHHSTSHTASAPSPNKVSSHGLRPHPHPMPVGHHHHPHMKPAKSGFGHKTTAKGQQGLGGTEVGSTAGQTSSSTTTAKKCGSGTSHPCKK